MLRFVTGNADKFREVRAILRGYGIEVEWASIDVPELQFNDISVIAAFKALEAAKVLKGEVLVEDAGLFIDALNGFPGPFSSYVFATIGCEGILKLLRDVRRRGARFVSVIAYVDRRLKVRLFRGVTRGRIAHEIRGGGWGFDPIFIPRGYAKTYGELGEEKNRVSHRFKSLKRFAEWYSFKRGRASSSSSP